MQKIDTVLISGFILVNQLLQKEGVSYCLIGGMAVGVWAEERYTKDADFTVVGHNENLDHLALLLEKEGFEVEKKALSQLVVNNLKGQLLRVDFILAEIDYQFDLVKRAIVKEVFQTKVPVCTPEDLIILKTIANRRRDAMDIESILKAQTGHLDLEYLKKWFQYWDIQTRFREEFEKDFPQFSYLWT